MKLITIIFLFLNCYAAIAQQLDCNRQAKKIPSFTVDSTVTFNNDFVRHNAISNIKNSIFKFEVRLYSIGTYNVEGTIDIVQSDGTNLLLTKMTVYLNKNRHHPTLTPIYKNNVVVAHMNSTSKEIPIDCSILKKLINNELFTFQSTDRSEFKRAGIEYLDAHAEYTFEIKVDDKVRNFRYSITSGYKDTIRGRRKKIDQLIEGIKLSEY